MRSSLWRFVVFAALAACASSGGSRAYVAPTNDNVLSSTDVRPGSPPTYVITVTNGSSVPIVVWNTSIYNCENVRDSCLPKNTNIRIPAFGSATVARIEPENTRLGLTYRFRYSWRPEQSPGSAAVTALAGVDPKLSAVLRELRPADFRTLGQQIAKIRPDPESLFIRPGERAEFDLRRVIVLDARDSILGFTRMVNLRTSGDAALQIVPAGSSGVVTARGPARGKVYYSLPAEMQTIIGRAVPDAEMQIISAFGFDADAPTYSGRVLDSVSRAPMACVRVAVEDTAKVIVSRSRTDAGGAFSLKAPRAGAYRVRVETSGWYPWYSTTMAAAAKEEKREDHLVTFTEQMLGMRSTVADADYEPARPAAVRFEAGAARPATRNTPVIHGVDLTGSAILPILSVSTPLPTQTLWAQFTVDTAGRVDTTSMLLPAGTAANVRAAIRYVMPRVRFTPARDEGKVACELVRLQVNISPR